MSTTVTLKSRYGEKRTLTVLDENTVRLVVDGNPEYPWQFGSSRDTGKLTIIDPPGGPFISVRGDLQYLHPELPAAQICSLEHVLTADNHTVYNIGVIPYSDSDEVSPFTETE